MKRWFLSLMAKTQNLIIIIGWVLSALCCILIGTNPSTSDTLKAFDYVLVIFLNIFVIFSFIFTYWKLKIRKKNTENSTSNNAICTISNNSTKLQQTDNLITNNISENNRPQNNNIDVVDAIKDNFSFTHSFEYPKNVSFLFIDVETATKSNDAICAIGIISVIDGMSSSYYSLINPKTHITNTNIHGISDSDVSNAPFFNDYWTSIIKDIGDDYIIVGHNISFDISVIQKDLARFGLSFNPTRKIDTMAVAKNILYDFQTSAGDLKLDCICQRLNIPLLHHNAGSDISATKQVLEKLLFFANRNIEEFVNVHYSANRNTTINNIKNVSVSQYWDDIEAGILPLYFTNWDKEIIDYTPVYDEVELEYLVCSSMMNRENCGIKRIEEQANKIKNTIFNIGGKVYGKGAKTAKCYIEFYYMDIREYQKLRIQGYKIYHANSVENFIDNNKEQLYSYIENKKSEEKEKRLQIEKKKQEKEEAKFQRQLENVKDVSTEHKNNKKLIQLDNNGNIIKIYEKLSNAISETGINSKSIRDCCNGIQKHAGGYVWKYIDDDLTK